MKKVLRLLVDIFEPDGTDWMNFKLTKDNPYTYHRLNLSICQSIKLYVPVNISEDHNLYQNIIDQGYDPFDINE